MKRIELRKKGYKRIVFETPDNMIKDMKNYKSLLFGSTIDSCIPTPADAKGEFKLATMCTTSFNSVKMENNKTQWVIFEYIVNKRSINNLILSQPIKCCEKYATNHECSYFIELCNCANVIEIVAFK